MVKYKKIYLEYFGYVEQDFIPCEVCGNMAVDVHHLDARGMGGSKTKDYIENLCGLCRKCHTKCERDKAFNDRTKVIHKRILMFKEIEKKRRYM